MEKREAIEMLQNKAKQLGRLPKKSDFDSVEIAKIKAKLGPWNRAIEEAGLKPVSQLYLLKKQKIQDKRKQKNEKKH